MCFNKKKKQSIHFLENTNLELSKAFLLEQNDPNPFQDQTTIRFYVPRAGQVKLQLFAWDKKLVYTLYQGEAVQGWHRVTWRGETEEGVHLMEGSYQYRLEADGFVAIRTLEIKA